MPVMRHLDVGGVTYDTVGEASVTQVQTSGTKIATVSIDGTSTDLYAPEGGSSVEPSSTTPAMDGTAAVGTATTYARADHVHPTDTSRLRGVVLDTSSEPYGVPVSNSLATITIGDGLEVSDSGNRATLSAKIKTINNTSLLGSGNIAIAELPSVSSSDNGKVLRVVNGAWAAASLPSASGVSF